MQTRPAKTVLATKHGYRVWSWLAALWLVQSPVHSAEALKVVEVNFTSLQGSPALDIRFNQGVRYRSHNPIQRGRLLSIEIEAATASVSGIESNRYRDRIPVQARPGIPVVSLELTVEDTGANLDLGFKVPVNFRVGQFSAANSIQVLLPNEADENSSVPAAAPAETVPAGVELRTISEAEMFARGKQAMQKGDNALAIRIFSKILSLADNKFTQDSLELLAVARSRNDQLAQAKLIYQQYLKKYPEGDAAIRVRQRLAELLSGEYVPQEKLKETKGAAGTKSGSNAHLFATLSQYYAYTHTSLEVPDSALLSNQVTVTWRNRGLGREVKHFLYASHNYDVELDTGDPVIINTLYSKIKDTPANYSAALGRQTSTGGGILGRYDGFDYLYGVANRWHLGLSVGTPVDVSRKDRIQREKRFYSLRLELDDLVKDWYVTPYYYVQTVESITDREALGLELRYFKDTLSIFNQIDYDTFFKELNIYLLRTQYKLTTESTVLLNVDYRRSPLLETSRAIYSDPTLTDISQLTATMTEAELRQLALDFTGDSKLVTLGINQEFGAAWQLSVDVTSADQTLRTPSSGKTLDHQTYLNLRLGRSNLLVKNDSMFTNLRLTQTDSYSESLLLLTHRLLISRSHWQTRIRYGSRNTDRNVTERVEPSLKLNYKQWKNADIEVEMGVEKSTSSDNLIEPNYTRSHVYLGYQYIFD